MELERIAGLPAHPLFAHLPVVLIPLAGLVAIVLAVRPAWLDRFGWGLVALAGVGMAGAVMAAGSGEGLEEILERSGVGESGLLEEHIEIGELARTVSIVFFLVVLGVVAARSVARRRAEGAGMSRVVASRGAALAMGAVMAVSAVGATAVVAAAGHKGAEAHWRRVEKLQQVDADATDQDGDDDDD